MNISRGKGAQFHVYRGGKRQSLGEAIIPKCQWLCAHEHNAVRLLTGLYYREMKKETIEWIIVKIEKPELCRKKLRVRLSLRMSNMIKLTTRKWWFGWVSVSRSAWLSPPGESPSSVPPTCPCHCRRAAYLSYHASAWKSWRIFV